MAYATNLSGLDIAWSAYATGGIGSASGGFVDDLCDHYEELGASAEASGSSGSRLLLVVGGGAGARLALRSPFSLYCGVDLGRWGLSLSGESADGVEFAAAELECLALALQAELGASFRVGAGRIRPSAGLFIAMTLSDYTFEESLSGVYQSVEIAPVATERLFWGAGLGADYLFKAGPGELGVGLRGELGLSPLAAEEGALGGTVTFPMRLLARATYEFRLGRKYR